MSDCRRRPDRLPKSRPVPFRNEAPARQPTPKPRLQPRIQTSAIADVEPLTAPPPDQQVVVASQSVPAPETTAPPEVAGDPVSLSVPIEFFMRGR
ncbi:hypothetical protein [Brevundimonas diminuta]|uniref:hypothetical protein n=1 Tax=Brevundimonas diminuta TaxID=293 RepID=UPI003CFBFEAA